MSPDASLPPEQSITLLKALSAALAVAAKARSVEEGLFFQIHTLRDAPNQAIPELRALLAAVKSIPHLEIFDAAEQHSLGQSHHVDHLFLVRWLISRAQQVGAESAVSDLNRYLQTDALDLVEVLAVDGFSCPMPVSAGGFEIVPWQSVPISDTKWRVLVHQMFSWPHPSSALLRKHSVSKVHIRPWDLRKPTMPLSLEPAIDVLRCITAVSGAGVRLLHYWVEPPDWAPWATVASNFAVDASAHSMDVQLSASDIELAKACSMRLSEMEEPVRLRLRVPLDRLNRSVLAGYRSVDAAIELGIALESLFAPKKLTDGISFALRARAARFLGGTLEERRRTSATVNDIYDLRSLAVHAGRFDVQGARKKWRDSTQVIQAIRDSQALTGLSLAKVIQEGEPDWEEIDIA